MNFKTRHIGSFGGRPAQIIELTVGGWGSSITETITSLNGMVSDELIQELRDLADELEEHNVKKNNASNN